MVRVGDWTLVSRWGPDLTNWSAFAAALRATTTPDGFLVIDPALPGWKLGPTDGPDVRIGDYAFFGPAHARCLGTFLSADERCNADRVLTRALDPSLADTLDDIDVEYTPAKPAP